MVKKAEKLQKTLIFCWHFESHWSKKEDPGVRTIIQKCGSRSVSKHTVTISEVLSFSREHTAEVPSNRKILYFLFNLLWCFMLWTGSVLKLGLCYTSFPGHKGKGQKPNLSPHLLMYASCLLFESRALQWVHCQYQCCGSMAFWGGSGSESADPCRWLMDPDPDPAIFVIDLQDASKKLIFWHNFFCLLLSEGTFTSFFKDKKSKRATK